MRRIGLCGMALLTLSVLGCRQTLPLLAAPSLRATFSVQGGNVAFSTPVIDDRHVVYGVAQPRFHQPGCVSCGQQPFTNFHIQLYLRTYQHVGSAFTISPAHPLFTGPRGAQIALYGMARNWLVYDVDLPSDRWHLYARNVFTGRVISLDSPASEGTPSRFLHASTDGTTVVWQSWTKSQGQVVSVIRSYTFATGKRQLLLSGGTGSNYFYGYPEVSGNRIVLVKEPGNGETPRILVDNTVTHRLRTLTMQGQWNDEPTISGSVVVWEHGRLTSGHSHTLMAENLTTGRRVVVPRSSSQLPRVLAGRYVVFVTSGQHPTVQTYDMQTGRRWTVFPGTSASEDQRVGAAGTLVLYQTVKPCVRTNACASSFILASVA